jgi:hypothetical protein
VTPNKKMDISRGHEKESGDAATVSDKFLKLAAKLLCILYRELEEIDN